MNQYTNYKNLYDTLRAEVAKHIVGNERLVDLTTMSILTGMSTTAEGESGIGKTYTAEVALKASGLSQGLITLSGDTMPSDITGNMYYDLKSGDYKTKLGPFNRFTGMLLDELNRTSDRVWHALLDILNSKRVVIDGVEYQLDDLSVMLATLNPIESEGTRPLPRALRDRLDWSVWVEYPTEQQLASISKLTFAGNPVQQVLDVDDVKMARSLFTEALRTVSDQVHAEAARIAHRFMRGDQWEVKASPRTVISMVVGATAQSLATRGEASPNVDDVRGVAYNSIRHTVEPREWMTTADKEQLIKNQLQRVGVVA